MIERTEIPPGTLYMLILKTLQHGPLHGYAIAQRIHLISEDVLRVEEGSLYPALQRMLIKGWVKAQWGRSEIGRRARLYTLTTAGRKQLGNEISEFDRVMKAVYRVIETA
jgi:PadR family transcriptional regulator, regulatory protein PadR